MKERASDKKVILGVLTVVGLFSACIVFSILDVYGVKIAFIQKNTLLFSLLSAALLSVIAVFSICFLCYKKEVLFRASISVFVFVLFCLVLIFIFQKTGFFEIARNEETLRKYLEGVGIWMPLAFILLQYFQVILLPIPGVVSMVVGIALFGPVKTVLYSLCGILLGSFTAFFIGRKLGYKAVVWMVGKETLNKWQKKIKGKDNFILTIMFFMPFFPDDILCFITGLSSMTTKYFSIMIILARIVSLTATCISISFIPFRSWWGLLIWGIILLVVVVGFIFVYKHMDRVHSYFVKTFPRAQKKENEKTNDNKSLKA